LPVPNNVMVAFPAYAGSVHAGFQRSLIADMFEFAQRGDVVTLLDECHGAEIDTARAEIVARFLASKAQHLIMIDSDLCWERGALLKLVDAGKSFVAGAYPHRKDPITWSLHLLPNHDGKLIDGLLEVEAVPGGFVCVTRDMLQDMCSAYPEMEFTSSKTEHRCWALFDHVWRGKIRLSEDLSFCARWRDMGGKIWVDPSIRIGHIGMKLFQGVLAHVK